MNLRPGRIDVHALASAELTYPEHGGTRDEPLPSGYHHVIRRARIGTGTAAFHRAVDAVLTWQMHRGAGFTVLSAPPTAALGAVAVLRLGPPLIGIVVPCRVVYVVEEPRRQGFAYGTLPGHPERGEESFVVSLTDDDQVEVEIRAFSQPVSLVARAGGPVGRAFQRFVTARYIHALGR